MKRKLYIINNGMKDLRGHYFETSVSIAEASRSLGFHPILAAHVTCPCTIVPDALEFHPVFTTDHWMAEPPPPQPDLLGLRGELAPLASSSIEDLMAGKIGFDQYLEARFLPEDTAPGLVQPGLRSVRRRLTPELREQIRRIARAVLPPAVQELGPGIARARRSLKRVIRQLVPPFIWSRLQALRAGRAASAIVTTSSLSTGGAAMALERIGNRNEYGYSIRFRDDLERLLSLTGCTSEDHIYMPTAHGRELYAVLDLLSRWPVELRPTFHLEFRHALALSGDGSLTEEHPYCATHRVYFEAARTFPFNRHVRLYTDTEGLSEEYERISGMEFGVLPIPFRSQLLSGRSRETGPLCIAQFGDVRDEKGFHWLPDLIDAMMDDYIRPGRVRFLIQASLIHPEYEPKSKAALELLKGYSRDSVRLVGLDGPLKPDSYYRLVSEADLVLCPYDAITYRNRSSGTLAEAIAAGIPTVVPQDSWLSSQPPLGSGKTFFDLESFIDAVRSICDDYPTYYSRTKSGRYSWLAHHSPERLVRSLLGERDEPSAIAGKVA